MLGKFCHHWVRIGRMGLYAWPIVAGISASNCHAHHPNYETMPVHPRIEPIPPWLNNLPSYRERYNRPRYLGGKIAYLIEPSSQEAMSWHRSVHRGYYANHAPRMEDRYYYPKPWQVLTVGPRVPVGGMEDKSPIEPIQPDLNRDSTDSELDGSLGPEALEQTLPPPLP